MFTRVLIGLVAVGAAVIGGSGIASADPEPAPAPPPPGVNSFAPVKPSEYSVLGGEMYAFKAPGDLTCILSRQSGRYGCSGPIPNAPGGATVIAGNQVGAPGFATSDAPIIRGVDDIKVMPANSRISFRNITCGTDGVLTTCQNNFDQSGFVISPAGSFVLSEVNPLVDRPQGTNPYAN